MPTTVPFKILHVGRQYHFIGISGVTLLTKSASLEIEIDLSTVIYFYFLNYELIQNHACLIFYGLPYKQLTPTRYTRNCSIHYLWCYEVVKITYSSTLWAGSNGENRVLEMFSNLKRL